MKEGEPVLGGNQATPRNIQSSNFGPQPVVSATPQAFQTTEAPQPIPPAQPANQLITQTFSPNNTAGVAQPNNLALQPQSASQPPQSQFQTQPQFPAQSVPITSGVGDITLGTSKPKEQKKWLFIMVFFIIAVGAISCMAFFIYKPTSNSSFSTVDVRTSFNIYANYLLFEENSSNDITISNWPNDKILENLNLNEGEDTVYFVNLLNLFDEFSEKVKNNSSVLLDTPNSESQNQNSEDNENIIMESLVNNTTSALEALKLYSEINRYSVVDMVEIFLSQGGEKLVETVKNSYDNIVSPEYSQIREYTELEIKIATLVSDVYTEYINVGCISNGELIKNCLNNVTFSEVYIENKALLDNYAFALDDINYHITNDAVALSRMIYEELNTMETYE